LRRPDNPARDRAAAASLEQERSVLSLVQESLRAQPLIRAFSLEQMGATAFRHRNDILSRTALRAGAVLRLHRTITAAEYCFCRCSRYASAPARAEWRNDAGRPGHGAMLLLMLSNALIFCRGVSSVSARRPEWNGFDPARLK